MPESLSIFTRKQAATLGRCLDCGCHEPTQGHKSQCPSNTKEGDASLQG